MTTRNHSHCWISQLRKISFAIVHSTTILLPAWFEILDRLKLTAKKMLRDVATWWNSTFDMIEFAIAYRRAIDDMTGDKTSGLRQYELNDEEWEIADQLCNVLKVCLHWVVLSYLSPCT